MIDSSRMVVVIDEGSLHYAVRVRAQLPNLTVAQLEYLAAAVDAPTWGRAAEQLGVSPSALSQGIAELERRLGLVLFEPEGRRRVPAVEAGPVVDHARRVLAQTRDLIDWATQVRTGEVGALRVGMIDAAAIDHFPDVLRRYRDDHPDVDLHLVVAPSGDLLEQVRRGQLDLAVGVRPDASGSDVTITPVLDEPLFVYGPPGSSRRSGPREWGPWVTFPDGSSTRAVIIEALRDAGASVEIVAESNQPDVLREMTRLGLGWTVLPASRAERGPARLNPARKRPLTTRSLAVARRSSALPHPAADALEAALLAAGRG
jgi:DNA-binding transcriptional LysR family regulator